jgi:predicted nucleic acid-binding Zn ribbon protein
MTDPQLFADLERRQQQERARFAARSPKSAKKVIGRLMSQRGYGRVLGNAELAAAWRTAVEGVAGTLIAGHTRAGNVRNGVLEVIVSGSTWMQELTFIKAEILARLQAAAPDQGVRSLRFKTGAVG